MTASKQPAVIQVDMHVTRSRVFRKEGLVEVWGRVGDYEVCLPLPADDPRAQLFLGQTPAPNRDPKPRARSNKP